MGFVHQRGSGSYSDAERERLRARITEALPDGTPLEEVIAALGTVIFEICEDHCVSAERTLEAQLAAIRRYRQKVGS